MPGVAEVWVAIDGRPAGVIRCSDPLRADAAAVVARVRATGARPMLLTGDASSVGAEVAAAVGIADIHGDATPEGKAEAVSRLRREGEVVVMVGDGLNDAPALAAADVGVALGATGSTISSDAAEAVMLVDDLGRVAEAIEIGRYTLGVARTGIVVGMGLSGVLMLIAAFGGITPLHGALAQEAIDVAAILNGLRALGGGRTAVPPGVRGARTAGRRRLSRRAARRGETTGTRRQGPLSRALPLLSRSRRRRPADPWPTGGAGPQLTACTAACRTMVTGTGRAPHERVGDAAEHGARERAVAARSDHEQIGAEHLRGVGDRVDDVAVRDMGRGVDAGLAGVCGCGLGDVLGSVALLDLEDRGAGSRATCGLRRPHRQHLKRGSGLLRDVDCDIERVAGSLAAVGGDQDVLHVTLLA